MCSAERIVCPSGSPAATDNPSAHRRASVASSIWRTTRKSAAVAGSAADSRAAAATAASMASTMSPSSSEMDGAPSKAVGAHATRHSDSAIAAPENDATPAGRADDEDAAADTAPATAATTCVSDAPGRHEPHRLAPKDATAAEQRPHVEKVPKETPAGAYGDERRPRRPCDQPTARTVAPPASPAATNACACKASAGDDTAPADAPDASCALGEVGGKDTAPEFTPAVNLKLKK